MAPSLVAIATHRKEPSLTKQLLFFGPMETTFDYRRTRLQDAIEKVAGGNKSEFGRMLGLKDGAFIRQMISGSRPISEKTVAQIEAMPGLKGWFSLQQENISPLVTKGRVPLISWVQAGEMQDVVDVFHPGEAVQWEDAIHSTPSKGSFALLVEGESMISPTPGAVSFPPGTVLIVDPDRAANAGDFVIGKDVATQKATFKQLTTDGVRWYLRPLNPQYPVIEIDDPSLRIVGRVIEAKPPSIKL